MNTGCLKIFKKAAQFDSYGTFIPPHRRGEDTQLFRGDSKSFNKNNKNRLLFSPGCFLVAVPDSCYDSSHDGLSYCWCSHTDLCNSGQSLQASLYISSLVALSVYLLLWYFSFDILFLFFNEKEIKSFLPLRSCPHQLMSCLKLSSPALSSHDDNTPESEREEGKRKLSLITCVSTLPLARMCVRSSAVGGKWGNEKWSLNTMEIKHRFWFVVLYQSFFYNV